MKRSIIILTVFLALTLTLASNGKSDEGESSKPVYFVSILPQAYMLERIGGDRIDVKVMVPPGKSPATYEPTPRQVMELGQAKMFMTIGVPFEEAFLSTLEESLPQLSLVDGAEGIERRHLEAHSHDEEGEPHEGEDDHDHEEGSLDPHVWVSPVLAQTISRNMAKALIASDPEGKDVYEENLAALLADLEDLDSELEEILAPVKGSTLFVYHPAFGYLADRYGLHQEAIELGGKEPSPADLERIINSAREDGVKIILVQPEFSQSSAQAVAKAIGGAVVPAEPLNKDYISNLKTLATQLREGLQ